MGCQTGDDRKHLMNPLGGEPGVGRAEVEVEDRLRVGHRESVRGEGDAAEGELSGGVGLTEGDSLLVRYDDDDFELLGGSVRCLRPGRRLTSIRLLG